MVVTEHCYGSGWPRGDDCSIFASTGPNSQVCLFQSVISVRLKLIARNSVLGIFKLVRQYMAQPGL